MPVEACRQHQQIKLVQDSIRCAYATRLNARDAVGYQCDIALLHGRVERVGHDKPLAGGAIAGGQLPPQIGIGDVLLKVGSAGLFDLPQLVLVTNDGAREGIDESSGPERVRLA